MAHLHRQTGSRPHGRTMPSRREPIDHVRVRVVALLVFLVLLTLVVVLGTHPATDQATVQPAIVRLP